MHYTQHTSSPSRQIIQAQQTTWSVSSQTLWLSDKYTLSISGIASMWSATATYKHLTQVQIWYLGPCSKFFFGEGRGEFWFFQLEMEVREGGYKREVCSLERFFSWIPELKFCDFYIRLELFSSRGWFYSFLLITRFIESLLHTIQHLQIWET